MTKKVYVKKLNESLNDIYKSNTRHYTNVVFTLSDIEAAVANGWLNKKPLDSSALLTTMATYH